MSDYQFLLLGGCAVAGLVYCLWKTQSDWQRGGFTLRVLWGAVACLSAFFFVALLFAGSVLRHF